VKRPALRMRSASSSSTGMNDTSAATPVMNPSKPYSNISPDTPRNAAADMKSPAIAKPFCSGEMPRPAAQKSVAVRVRREAQ
jgi:hypothetical protein